MLKIIILFAVLGLAYANGANDNFNGVATLFGCAVARYRGALPGGRRAHLEETLDPARSSQRYQGANRDILSAAGSGPAVGMAPRTTPMQLALPQLAPEEVPPIYGSREFSLSADEGPPDSLTFEQAIDRLIRNNYDLRSTFYERLPNISTAK